MLCNMSEWKAANGHDAEQCCGTCLNVKQCGVLTRQMTSHRRDETAKEKLSGPGASSHRTSFKRADIHVFEWKVSDRHDAEYMGI